jgi:hypothetical protein
MPDAAEQLSGKGIVHGASADEGGCFNSQPKVFGVRLDNHVEHNMRVRAAAPHSPVDAFQ